MNEPTGRGTSVVVLAKDTRTAKTRLSLAPEDARRLALRLAATTVRSCLAAETVEAVLVVTSDPDIARDASAAGAQVVAERRPLGMDRAAALGRRRALAARPASAVAVIVADLPELRPGDVDTFVREFLVAQRPMFVPDMDGAGTTCVIHGHGPWPGVSFGRGSAGRHMELGYVRSADAPPSLRRDLDTADDLATFVSTLTDAVAQV